MSLLNLSKSNSVDPELSTLDLLNRKLLNLNDTVETEVVETVENIVEDTIIEEVSHESVDSNLLSDNNTISSITNITPSIIVEEITVNDTKPIICSVCGRKLKDPQSRIIGMGPMCAKHYRNRNQKPFNLFNIERIMT